MINLLLLNHFCPVISFETSSRGKESDGLSCTVRSFVMVRNQLPIARGFNLYEKNMWLFSLSLSFFVARFHFYFDGLSVATKARVTAVLSLHARPCICIAHISFFITIITSVSALCVEHNAARRSPPVTFASQQREHSRLSRWHPLESPCSQKKEREREREREAAGYSWYCCPSKHIIGRLRLRDTFLCFRRDPMEAGISPDCEAGAKSPRIYDSRSLKMGFKQERVRRVLNESSWKAWFDA